MNRRELLKSLGILGLGSMMPWSKTAQAKSTRTGADCWLSPAMTAGPFYFDAELLRQDIRTDSDTGEYHDGIPLNMTLSVVNTDCEPIPNVLVDIWHCDTPGLYSGYVQAGGDTTGEDFMRGYQFTDENGRCSFVTSYPGWYPGRATHIHFIVRMDSFTYVTSQFAFPNEINDIVYATPLYKFRGPNPVSNENDGPFAGHDLEEILMSIKKNSTGGYDGEYTIGIDVPTKIDQPSANPGGFSLEQNYPNPFNPTTTIKYRLAESREVDLRIYDALGRQMAELVRERQSRGTYEVVFDAAELRTGYYFYRFVAGDFAQTREMLLIR